MNAHDDLPGTGNYAADTRWLLALIDENEGRSAYSMRAQHTMREIEAALAAPKEAGGGAGAEDVRRLQECESAWMAIVETLDERSPGWRGTTGRCMDHAVNAIRRLAAPSKEAGDGPFAFDTLVAHGLANGANVVNGMPWSFKYMDLPVTHENDNHYLVNMPDGSTLNVYRCAPCPIDGLTEPHVGMDPPHQYLDAPQADQQGASLEGDSISRMCDEVREAWTHGEASLRSYMKAALIASKASPDDQRQEGAVLDWTAGGTRHDYERIGPVSGEVARQLIHDAYQAGRTGIGYSAQIDALHDAASPPTEAAAAAGELQEEVWRASLNGGLPEHIRILLIRVYAALSPTASAAREDDHA